MYYPYNFIEVEPKMNKWKIFVVVLIIITIIILSIYGGIKYAKYMQDRNAEEELQKEQEIIEEQKRIEEEKEAKRLKNARPLTEEQMVAIENIYTSEEKRVFLTFDDGPTTSVTPFILDLLKQENIKATFFVLGNRAKSNPDLIKRIFEEGHYIANHGYTHKYSSIYTNSQTVLDEYNYTESCIQEALENPDYHSRVFRFPGGSVRRLLQKYKKGCKSAFETKWNSFIRLELIIKRCRRSTYKRNTTSKRNRYSRK